MFPALKLLFLLHTPLCTFFLNTIKPYWKNEWKRAGNGYYMLPLKC